MSYRSYPFTTHLGADCGGLAWGARARLKVPRVIVIIVIIIIIIIIIISYDDDDDDYHYHC